MARQYDWADYARGAVKALRWAYPIHRGVAILVDGQLSEAGISSSAAVGLGYLYALASVNELELAPAELIELDRQIENDFLGLKNGVLDQAAVTLAKPGHLTVIDCNAGDHRHVAQPQPFEFLAVYSGQREALVDSSKFNDRVQECLLAGATLHQLDTGEHVQAMPLGRVGEAAWQRQSQGLPEHYQRRAAHFFAESARVLAGEQAWAASDRVAFGDLMVASCESSIHNYETGSREMIRLFEILVETQGVVGARFSGAGFRGCAVALIEPTARDEIAAQVAASYGAEFPHLAEHMWAIHTRAAAGLRLL
jgi:galactokinase/galacturonokinase